MPRPTTYQRSSPPAPDARGRVRPIIGKTLDGKSYRFTVGTTKTTSPAEMTRRLDAIRTLYDAQCRNLNVDHWVGWVQCWAVRLAQQTPLLVYGEPYHRDNSGAAREDLTIVRRLQSWGVPIVWGDPTIPTMGLESVKSYLDQQVTAAVERVLGDAKTTFGAELVEEAGKPAASAAASGSLHEALTKYVEHVRATGKRDASGELGQFARKCIERIESLREHHADLPLWRLDDDGVEGVVAHWRNRPQTKRGTRCKRRHAQLMLQEVKRFFKWLDGKHNWRLPGKFHDVNWRPVRLPEDNGKHATAFRSTTKPVYTPQQLALIVRHADPLGRATIAMCVNCAFGASEIGQLPVEDVHLYKAHPHAAVIGIESSGDDSWVVSHRPKTAIYGEHLLWDEVAVAVQPYLEDRKVLPVTRTGKPWYNPRSKNPQAKFANWFTSLVNRIRETPEGKDMPRLPFGSLRDVLPNILRRNYSDEVASLAIQHGQLSEDELLNRYADLPFKRLFEATRELRDYFKPLLSELRG